jgi:hypothetical protein
LVFLDLFAAVEHVIATTWRPFDQESVNQARHIGVDCFGPQRVQDLSTRRAFIVEIESFKTTANLATDETQTKRV